MELTLPMWAWILIGLVFVFTAMTSASAETNTKEILTRLDELERKLDSSDAGDPEEKQT